MSELIPLHLDIDRRVQSVLEGRTEWPCRMGCDRCCRQLAQLPRLTLAEWEWLREGLAALPPERLADIGERMQAASIRRERPHTCPLLDLESGACPVYAHRPVACRTYGFYVQRELGLYCGDIESQVAAGALSDVVWGNHDAIDRRLATQGEVRTLTDWFGRWVAGDEKATAPRP